MPHRLACAAAMVARAFATDPGQLDVNDAGMFKVSNHAEQYLIQVRSVHKKCCKYHCSRGHVAIYR